MNLQEACKRVKYSKNDKRFYTRLDMAIIKQNESIVNSEVKRGKRKKQADRILTCSCGVEGCFGHI